MCIRDSINTDKLSNPQNSTENPLMANDSDYNINISVSATIDLNRLLQSGNAGFSTEVDDGSSQPAFNPIEYASNKDVIGIDASVDIDGVTGDAAATGSVSVSNTSNTSDTMSARILIIPNWMAVSIGAILLLIISQAISQ
eukprot:TRINITY_DN2099_c0_g5_i2.p2 TRINITY_DN2099_c0_g5~~TRINITY_DN2099_c0_g5_i2.p2  ORF type:complete len:141 (-),score=42.52 TRINITY_DN2099_c0_g5_i2:129-551(-)